MKYSLGQKITVGDKLAIVVAAFKDSSERNSYYVFVEGKYKRI